MVHSVGWLPHCVHTETRPWPVWLDYLQQTHQRPHAGADWRHYDRQFRVDREYSHCSWATVRVDLQLTATLKSTHTMTRNNQPFRQASQPFKANTTRQQSRLPTGYCFSYHSQSVRWNVSSWHATGMWLIINILNPSSAFWCLTKNKTVGARAGCLLWGISILL